MVGISDMKSCIQEWMAQSLMAVELAYIYIYIYAECKKNLIDKWSFV